MEPIINGTGGNAEPEGGGGFPPLKFHPIPQTPKTSNEEWLKEFKSLPPPNDNNDIDGWEKLDSWVSTLLTTKDTQRDEAVEAARREGLRMSKIDAYQIEDIVQETIGEAYQKRFNKNIDYDQWAGIRDEMRMCAHRISEKWNNLAELNYQTLTKDPLPEITK